MERVDKVLVRLNYCGGRSAAVALITSGNVLYKKKVVKKASLLIENTSELVVLKGLDYVGRGGDKMAGAITSFQVDFKNKIIADVGASTGGFTDYALQNGAQKVHAIDVGRDQLAAKLKADERVINHTGINIRHGIDLGELADLAVVDLSFISLKLVMLPIFDLIKETGHVIALYKPQFEVGQKFLSKKGIVKDAAAVLNSYHQFYLWCQQENIQVTKFDKCILKGGDGNQEFFVLLNKLVDVPTQEWDAMKRIIEESYL